MKNIATLAVIFGVLMSGTALAANYAYVLKFSTNEADQVVRFNADTDEIVNKIDAPDDSGWNNFIVDERGGCFIASYRKSFLYGRDIFYYDPETKRVEHFAGLGEIFGPQHMALTRNELIVSVGGYSGVKPNRGGVVFINRNTGKINGEIMMLKDDKDLAQADVNYLYYDGGKYLILAMFYMPGIMADMDEWRQMEYTGDLFLIDIMEKKIAKIINVPREYKGINRLCRVGDKIYVSAYDRGQRDQFGSCPINNELLVFSLESGKLIKTIRIDGFPFDVVHDKSVNKIYICHRNERVRHDYIEVIDPSSDRVIKRITIPNQLMASIVAPHKMYVTSGNSQFEHRSIPSKLSVVDTGTDKVIKEFEGVYTGISINPEY